MAVCMDCHTNKTFERGVLRCSACQALKDAADERARAGLPSVQSGHAAQLRAGEWAPVGLAHLFDSGGH
jgi:hypothetical protein